MKAASLAEIKRELKSRNPEEVLQMCLRLGRFKVDNKELLTYLLFEAEDERGFIQSIKNEIDELLEEVNTSHPYYAKKGLRKIQRVLNKNIRYSGNKNTEVEARLYFCQAIKQSGIPIEKNTTLTNLFNREIQRIEKALLSLHEDIQADYQYEIERL
ncbi:MAG: hypothetical protein ABJP45_19395 [Cyclobacteriaceae bacterium]